MAQRGINDRLISRPSIYDSLLDSLLFVTYPSPGILYDLAGNRSADENKGAPTWGYADDGTPGVQCQGSPSGRNGGVELWSPGNTTDIRMYNSGAGASGAFAFWLWVYVKAVSTSVTDFCEVIRINNYVTEGNNQGWGFTKAPKTNGSDGTPQMWFELYNNNSYPTWAISDNTLTLAAGQIHQYVGDYRFDPAGGAGQVRLYRDNALRSSPLAGGYKAPTSVGLAIGGYSASGADNFLVLGFGVWHRSLTDAEINALYHYPEALLAQPTANANQILRLFRPAPPAAVIERRTLVDLGTRTGSRQMR